MNDIVFALTVLRETGSTNDDLKAVLTSNITSDAGILNFHGYSELAFVQTAGHGRFERVWDSRYGGLYLSTLLFMQKLGQLNLTAVVIISSLSVMEAIEQFCGKEILKIKWPNDITAYGKKLCGILLQTIAGSPGTPVIIGIGVNVFNEINKNKLRDSAILEPITLKEITSRNYFESDIITLSNEILSRLNYNFKKADNGHYDEIFSKYNSRLLYTGEKIELFNRIEDGEKIAEGIFYGLDKNGFILIKSENLSEPAAYPSGEIKKI